MYGTTATYSCDTGFGLSGGDKERVCGGNGSSPVGEWNGIAPHCEEQVTCLALSDPENGRIEYSSGSTGDQLFGVTATYICETGFGLTGGERVRTCEGDGSSPAGNWTGKAPFCSNVVCPLLLDPDNGHVTHHNITKTGEVNYGSIATFSCDTGYGLTGGEVVLTCGGDGTSIDGVWSSTPPSCEAIMCFDIVDPQNGQIDFTPDETAPFNYGTLAIFRCDPGYGLDRESTRQCGGNGSTVDGEWSGSSPTCGPIKCFLLANPLKGQVSYLTSEESYREFNLGTVAMYTCNEGYLLYGNNTRTCSEDDRSDTAGVWSRDAPVCLEITCPTLLNVSNGEISYDPVREGSFGVDTVATYRCRPGYALVGNTQRTCEDDNHEDTVGVWSGTGPSCESIQCIPLPTLSNGKIVYANDTTPNFDLGTQATFTCFPGYALVGNGMRTCIDDDQADIFGIWNGEVPSCEPILCPTLTPLENGHIDYSTNDFKTDTVATYICNIGYVLIGIDTRHCLDDDQMDTIGLWNGTAPYCKRIRCDSLFLDHGEIEYSSPGDGISFEYGTVALFTCNKDFELVGNFSRTCTGYGNSIHGYWTGVLTYCDAGECVYDSVFPFVDVTTFRNHHQLRAITEDPSSSPISIPDGVMFGEKLVTTAYVNENGVISFERDWRFAYPQRFPTSSLQTMTGLVVAPFWSDNDIRREGAVRYATYSVDEGTSNPAGAELLNRVNKYISTLDLEAEEFHGRWLLVAHWDGVHPSPHGNDDLKSIPQEQLNQINNYQAIVVSGVVQAYAIFTYTCGGIQWSSVGQNSLAVVGFNAGTTSHNNTVNSFKNYRLSGLEGVGSNISCEVKTSNLTNLIIKLPAIESQEQRSRLACILSLKEDNEILGSEVTHAELAEILDPCPCTKDQAVEDDARFIPLACEMESQDCYISASPKMLDIPSTNSSLTLTQQCCYQKHGAGALIASSADVGSGTMLLHHPHRDSQKYLIHDKALRNTCCRIGFCEKFYQQRVINNCSGYDGPQTSRGTGDPHYLTFDGRYHTFNGKGDFTILEIMPKDGVTPEFSIQGRLASVRLRHIVTHQGFAFGNENLAYHVATSASSSNGYRVYQTRPGPERDITNLLQSGPCHEWMGDSNNVMLKKVGRDIVLSFYQSGVSARVKVNHAKSNEYYLDLFVKVPRSLGLYTSGFLGSPDGNVMNDLSERHQNTSIPLYYEDRQLYSHMTTWTVHKNESLFFEGQLGRERRESGAMQRNGTNTSDTSQMPTNTNTNQTSTESEEEFVPIFFDQLNFTEAQTLVCEDDQQCLFDFAVSDDKEFAIETLESNKQAQEIQNTINNFPPNITANATFQVNLGVELFFLVHVSDPGDNFTLEVEGGLPVNSTLQQLDRGKYLFTWNLFVLKDIAIKFIANDSRGAASVFVPRVEICPCRNGGKCTLNGVISSDALVVLNCLCNDAYIGRFCEEDRDGCTEIQCFEGVECIDVPAPGVGAECGPCPEGYTGDSLKCYDIDECAENDTCSHICVNTKGSFYCACYDGYKLLQESTQCEDINECEEVNDCQQLCENTEGSYTCSCSEGFTLDSDNRTCNAIQPCGKECSFGCAVVNGTEQCYCPIGYELSESNGSICLDINECQAAVSPCEQLCNNNEGSFDCGCRAGYVPLSDNRRCQDINECFEAALSDKELCESNSQCVNTEGSFNCECVSGFTLVNGVCQPIVCLEVTSIANGSVVYTTDDISPFELGTRAIYSCALGFVVSGDISRVCRSDSSSPIGLWTKSSPECVDFDECSEASGEELICGSNSQCINLVGSYECVCKTGYVFINGSCKSSPPTIIPLEVLAIGAIEITLFDYTYIKFDEDTKQRFKEVSATIINDYCSQNLHKCQVKTKTKRQDGLLVTPGDIILTEIKDNAQGILAFLMLVQVGENVLIASDLQQAVKDGSQDYAMAKFPHLSSQPFFVATTSPPIGVASTLNRDIAVGFSIVAALLLFMVVTVVSIICYGKHRGRAKLITDEPCTSIQYQNPIADDLDSEKDKEACIDQNQENEEPSADTFKVDKAEKEEVHSNYYTEVEFY